MTEESADLTGGMNRRGFLGTGAGALAAAARDWHGADLEAARQACTNKLDFAKLLPRAEDCLG